MGSFVSQIAEATPAQMLSLAVGDNKALRSETANIGRVVAFSGETELEIQDPRCRAGRLAILIPLDATAAGVPWWLKSMTQGSMTFGFSTAPASDAEFGFAFLGDGNV
jgi:hypothetical protein